MVQIAKVPMYGKTMMIPVYTKSLVSFKVPSNTELPNIEHANEKPISPKKLQICFGDPIIKSLCMTRRSGSRILKTRSILPLLRVKSSYRGFRCFNTKYFKSSASVSADSRNFTSGSRSLSSTKSPSTSYIKSPWTTSPNSGSTDTILNSKFVRSISPACKSAHSISVRLSSPGSASYDSTSLSGSTVSRSSFSKYKFDRSRSPRNSRRLRSPLKSPASCLKVVASKSRNSRSPVTKHSCLRSTASKFPYSTSPRPCLRPSPLKSPRSRSPVPKKSCLKSPSKSPNSKPLSKPSCLRSLSKPLSKLPTYKPKPCLRSVFISPSTKSLASKPVIRRLSRLDSNKYRSPIRYLNLRSPISNLPHSRSPEHKSSCLKSVSFKTANSKSSRSTASSSPQSRILESSLVYSKTSSFKTADERSFRSRSPLLPRSCIRTKPAGFHFHSPPRSQRTQPRAPEKSKPSETKRRPKLTISKIHMSRLSLKRTRCAKRPSANNGRRKPSSSLVGLYDYVRPDQESRSRLTRRTKKDVNREYLQKLLATNMDVRYITELKNYFEKLKSTFTCNGAPECPFLQERLRRHMIEHHVGRMSYANEATNNEQFGIEQQAYRGGDVMGSEAQTKITLSNLGGLTISLDTRPISTNTSLPTVLPEVEPEQKESRKNVVIDRFRTDLENEIKEWVKKVPTRGTPEDADSTENAIRNLIYEINSMDFMKRDRNTDEMLKNEIDACLSNLNMWYPGSKTDREAFKEGLRENLFDKIINQKERLLESLQNIEDDKDNNMRNDNRGQNNKENDNMRYDNRGNDNMRNNMAGNRTQNYERNSNTGSNKKAFDNKENQINIVIEGKANISHGKPGTPGYTIPDRGQDPSSTSNTLNPAASNTLSAANDSRRPSKDQSIQAGPKPGIQIVDRPNYKNNGYTPDSGGQPRKPSLKSASSSYTNYNEVKNGPNNNEISNLQVGLKGPNFGKTPLNTRPNEICNINNPNCSKSPSYIVTNPKYSNQTIHDRRLLRNTTYDLSYGNSPDNDYTSKRKYSGSDDILETCKNTSRNNLNLDSYSDPTVKHTVKCKGLCACSNEKVMKKPKLNRGLRVIDMEKEVAEWLKKCTIIKNDGLLNRQDIIDALILQVVPYLSQPHYSLNKAVLKGKILTVLRGLGFCTDNTLDVKAKMYKLADDLANRLVGIASRIECVGPTNWKCSVIANRPYRYIEQVHVGSNQINREDLKHELMQEYIYSLQGTPLENNMEVLEFITDLIIDRIELIRRGIDQVVRNDVRNILQNTYALNDAEITNATNSILKNTREIIIMITNINNRTDTTITARPCLSGALAIYTSEHEMTPNFAAAGSSTPKKKKEVSKFGPEEKAYTDKVASVIREWLKIAPDYFENVKDQKMNELMILDMAGSIVDHVKLGQLINQSFDTEKFLEYYIFKCLLKFEIIEDVERAKPHTHKLVKKLMEINVPKMTRPQHGERQAIKNIKYQETEEAWFDPFVPEAQDILEDEISIWMNEYPSDIYVDNDKSVQNKLVREFAEKLQKTKEPDKDVSNEIKTWLKKIVKTKETERIDIMSKSLKERIEKLPTDETIVGKMQEKIKSKQTVTEMVPETEPQINQEESDKTMTEFIIKYVEHNSDEDDPLAKGAYAKLLRLELQRLSPLVLKEVYARKQIEIFCPDKVFMELVYIKDISDWLKTLPIDENYNRVGNNDRIEFCTYLAKDIAQTEEERRQKPDVMIYDAIIGSTICQFMHQLPLQLKDKNISKYIHALLIKIIGRRVENIPVSSHQEWENIADFIDDYLRLNGQDIADDEVKLEAWATRLLAEINKMIAENPSSMPSADFYDKLAQVAKPGNETIKRFNHELDYAKEISDWLKNLPLINSINEEMIRDLAVKMAEYEGETDDKQLVPYIERWIPNLPLDKSKQIDVPFAIQQLLNRRKKITEEKAVRVLPVNEPNKSKSPVKLRDSGSEKAECRGCCPVDDPGSIIVQVIKEWGDALPLEGSENDIKNARNDIISKLYQKISEINDDSRLVRNDRLYMETFSDRVDELLSNLPTNVALGGNKEKIKAPLLEKLQQARIFINEVSLGDEYMRDLEDAIESVLPNPAPNVGIDPGFEVYKENVAEMFIIENFDHGKEHDKLKYEQKLKSEIEKFAPIAQQRKGMSIVPEEQLYNDTILSTLFDVNMPDERTMTDNVEEIKTKCEILDWFEKLPLRPISELAELLERDQKVRLLARKMHILEFEKDPDPKIKKEIMKWLAKIPFLPGEEANIEEFANNLQQILKTSQKSRKCIKASDVKIGKGKESSGDDENSIWVNPNTFTDSGKELLGPPRLKSGDILIDIVEKWSNSIPLPVLPNNQLQSIKDDLTTQIIKKISELNSDPNTFNNDQLYNYLMNQEIGNALATLPQSDALMQSQGALMYQLTSAIESVKPLIREERAVHEYKMELEKTVSNFLGSLKNPTAEEQALLSNIQENLVDNFLEYQYNKVDDEGKQFYKNKMIEALTEYNFIGEKIENRNEIIADTLVEVNKLICELSKIPPPDQPALENEVEEARMKQEVDNFLSKLSSPVAQPLKNTRRDSLRNSLVKQLHDIERTGHNDDNNKKMEAAISRTLKKLNTEVRDDEINLFIDRLEKNEKIRKAPVYKNPGGNYTWSADLDGTNAEQFGDGPISTSLPLQTDLYTGTPFQLPMYPREPLPPSPSRALLPLMNLGVFPPEPSSFEDHAIHGQVDVTVYRPDYVPPNWKPPTPPPPYNQELLVVMPRQSLPPSPGPIGSTVMSRLTQPTQTATLRSGITQTPTTSEGRPFGPEASGPYGPSQRLIPFVSGQSSPLQSSAGIQSGSIFGPRPPGPPQASAGIQSGPTLLLYRPQASARVESEEDELTEEDCLCEMCINDMNPYHRSEYYENCKDFHPCERSMMPMPMPMPIAMPMPMAIPRVMIGSPYMYC